MAINRRKFLQLGFKTVVVIGAGNMLRACTGKELVLPSENEIQLRFAIASDGHYGQPNTDYVTKHDEMLAWLQADQQARGLNFIMINGDLYHDRIDRLPPVKKLWDQLPVQYYVSHGNHDKVDENIWEETWNMKWHYVFERDDAVFLVLNTADKTGKYICPDLEWTKTELDKYQSKKQLFVFMHITPFPLGGLDCPELVDMFSKQQNLKAIFNGHNHDQDNVKEEEGKHYFFDGHVAGGWGTDYRGYRIVEILKDGNILTYQMNPIGKKIVNSDRVL
jgi:Icc protein